MLNPGWILIDGYNLLQASGVFGRPGRTSLEGSREALLDWLGEVPEEVLINQLLEFKLMVKNPTSNPARIILILDIKEPGKGTKPRTSRYQIWHGKIPPEGSKLIQKKIHFVDKTTQAKLPGTYHLHLMLNGDEVAYRSFTFQRSS